VNNVFSTPDHLTKPTRPSTINNNVFKDTAKENKTKLDDIVNSTITRQIPIKKESYNIINKNTTQT